MAKIYFKKVKEGDPIANSLPIDFITEYVKEEFYTQDHIDAGITEELEEDDFNAALANNETILAAYVAEKTAPGGE